MQILFSAVCRRSSSEASDWTALMEALDEHDMNCFSSSMSYAIINSPSESTRIQAQKVFLWLLEKEITTEPCEKSFAESNQSTIKSVDGYCGLSLVLPMIPLGRKSEREIVNEPHILSRCSFVFDVASGLLQKMWDCRERNLDYGQSFVNSIVTAPQSSHLSSPPIVRNCHDFGSLFLWVAGEISCLPARERRLSDSTVNLESTRHGAYRPILVDFYLVGLLRLATFLIEKTLTDSKLKEAVATWVIPGSQSSILELVLSRCAFPPIDDRSRISLSHSPHFTSPDTRQSAIKLLLILGENCPKNIESIVEILCKRFHSTGPRPGSSPKNWNIDISLIQKNLSGFVGMKNQGATCYLNSLLQLLFHTPSFRDGILYCNRDAVPCTELDRPVESQLLRELQLVFGSLLYSEARDVDTCDLVKSIKGYDGAPLRPGEQQDVDEFFNLFCDLLSNFVFNVYC